MARSARPITRKASRYAYHHGYFDGYEREFRGFGLVEQWDTEEFRADTAFDDDDFVNWDTQSWSPPMLTRTWYHTGAFLHAPEVSQRYVSEYWTEPALRAPGMAASAAAMRPPDTVLPDGLGPFEVQEAYRALKGHALRIETYACDGTAAAANPYTVTEQNFTVSCLQHTGPNLHAVFYVSPRETVSSHYERGPADPRTGHEFTLETDAYGNVLRSVSVAYPRRAGYAPPEPSLTAAFQEMLAYDQGRLHVRGTARGYTNPVDDLTASPDAYRVPLAASVDVAEITGVAPAVKGSGITSLFTFDEIDGPGGVWPTVWTGTHDVPYEQIPGSDVDGGGTPAAAPTRRLIAGQRILYRRDDLTALLPPGQLQPLALPGQSYQAALTPGLLTAVFGALVPAATLAEGGYAQLPGEAGWWRPSTRVFYSPGDGDTAAVELTAARAGFFAPRRAVDPFGAIAHADFDRYALLPAAVTDAVGNVTAAASDYRVLLPATVTDPNGNRTSAAFDVLGQVTATAVMGKATESLGDLLTGFTVDLDAAALAAQFTDPLAGPAAILGDATSRFLYDLGAYQRTAAAAQPSPPASYTLARETHVSDLAAPPPYAGAPTTTRYQFDFCYCDGFGREIQRKAQVAPGPVTGGGPLVSPRWAGTGWTLFDNKGRPVRTYEPFFSATNAFEFAAQTGVSRVTCYDPPGRVVATLQPDNSWAKVTFGPWSEQHWDGNDTAAITDPRTDADVGGYFTRVLGTGPFTSWFNLRIGGTYGTTAQDRAAEQDAAQKAATAAGTPATTHRDALGRACLAVADNGGGARNPSRTAYDTEGKPLAVFDQLGRRAAEYCYRDPQPGGGFRYLAGTDMAGSPLYHVSADGGARRGLANIAGHTIRSWDARGHAFRLVYDAAQRPVLRYVSTSGAPEVLIELSVYGEGHAGRQPLRPPVPRLRHGGVRGAQPVRLQGQPARNGQAARRELPAGGGLDAAGRADHRRPARRRRDRGRAAAAGDGGRDRFAGSAVFDALNRPGPGGPAAQPGHAPGRAAARLRRGGAAQSARCLAAWRARRRRCWIRAPPPSTP